MKEKAIVLLSGGMDSSTALYWAAIRGDLDIAAVVHFSYSQRGWVWEYAAVGSVTTYLNLLVGLDIPVYRVPMRGLEGTSNLTTEGNSLEPGQKDEYGNPATFVPGRNLMQIARALPLCYRYGAHTIVGGWVESDVDYPDCNAGFLLAASIAASRALGDFEIRIAHPVLTLNKASVIELGEALEVPWSRTRSCYGDDFEPCGKCDSCLLRVAAFQNADMRDPIYPSAGPWLQALSKARNLGYCK